MLDEIVVSLAGIISFVLFLIFYRRITVKPFLGMTNIEYWPFSQMVFGAIRFGSRIRGWINGTDTDFEPILMIVVFLVTGMIMNLLAQKIVKAKTDKTISDDIDKQIDKLKIKGDKKSD